jgi:hypothetical protein
MQSPKDIRESSDNDGIGAEVGEVAMRRAVGAGIILAARSVVSKYLTASVPPVGVRTGSMNAWRVEQLTSELVDSDSTRLFDFNKSNRDQSEALHATIDLQAGQVIPSRQRLVIFLR